MAEHLHHLLKGRQVSPPPDPSFSSKPYLGFLSTWWSLVDPAADAVAMPRALWHAEPREPVDERQRGVWHAGAGRAVELPGLAALPASPQVPDPRSGPGERAVAAQVPKNTEVLLK